MRAHITKVANNTKIRFVVVVLANTLIDFSILNLLTHGLSVTRITANVVSVTVAMSFSFLANRVVVFGSKTAKKHQQIIRFVLITGISIYILQNLVILLLTEYWTYPLDTLYSWFSFAGRDVFMTNVSKLSATGLSLVWNFIFYKRYVFKDD